MSGSSAGHRFLVRDGVTAEVHARKFSTLDLRAFDAFTLIVNKSASERWPSVIEGASARLLKALKTYIAVLGAGCRAAGLREGREVGWELHLEEGGGALIRPDQHILETSREVPTAEEVLNALAEQLGLVRWE